MTTPSVVRAQVTRHVRAPADAVFDAWLNPELARRWFAPGLGEMTRVEIDARVGGTFWLVQRRGTEEAQHTGEYQELDRPRRLVFTWRTPPLTETSRVIIKIAPTAGGCELSLTHEIWQTNANARPVKTINSNIRGSWRVLVRESNVHRAGTEFWRASGH